MSDAITPILDERAFVAQALALEEEREHAFADLAESLEAHHNPLAAALLREIVCAIDADQVALQQAASVQVEPHPAPWECLWSAQSALHAQLYQAHYQMSPAEVVMLAIHAHELALEFSAAVAEKHPEANEWPAFRLYGERHGMRLEEMQRRLAVEEHSPAHPDLDPPNMPE